MDVYYCKLCEKKDFEEIYFSNSVFMIAKCHTCGQPIVILNEHRAKADQWEIDEMLQACRKLFNMDALVPDYEEKEFTGHFYFHLAEKAEKEVVSEEAVKEQEVKDEPDKPRAKPGKKKAKKKKNKGKS